jgi:hypothetical protein
MTIGFKPGLSCPPEWSITNEIKVIIEIHAGFCRPPVRQGGNNPNLYRQAQGLAVWLFR